MPDLAFENVRKVFLGDIQAVDGVSLHIAAGESFAFIGPSGSGKTTLLRLLAGLEKPTHGKMLIDNRNVTSQPAYQRQLGYVTQQSNLYPHLNVRQNLLSGIARAKADNRRYRLLWGWIPKDYRRFDPFADAFVSQLGIADLAERKPEELSAGQRQRVALARIALQETKILLFDEPLAHLDPIWNAKIQEDIITLQRERELTVVYVTHHQSEAFAIASRVGVLDRGKLVQVGTQRELWSEPSTRFVAEFVGQPAMNLVVWDENFRAMVPPQATSSEPDGLVFGVRPTDLQISSEISDGPQLVGKVIKCEPFADRWLCSLQTDHPNQTHREGCWRIVSQEPLAGEIRFAWASGRTHWFGADGQRLR